MAGAAGRSITVGLSETGLSRTGFSGTGGAGLGGAGCSATTGAAGFTVMGATGFATGGGATSLGTGGAGMSVVVFLIAFSTSPGLEILDKSILVLISSGAAARRRFLSEAPAFSDSP